MPAISRADCRCQGFTLLELMVVLCIIGLLAVAFPLAFDRTLPKQRVARTSAALVASIHEAQSISRLMGKPIHLRIDDHQFLLSTEISRVVSFPASVQASLSDVENRPVLEWIAFPDGSARGGRAVISESRYQSIVHWSDLTGRVSVEHETSSS